MNLVAVDDSKFDSNSNEENLRYFSIFPFIEFSITGELTPMPYVSYERQENSVVSSTATLDIPAAEKVSPELLEEYFEEDAAFWHSA